MRTAIKHAVSHRVKLSFVIFDIRALWRSGFGSARSARIGRMSKITKWRLNPVWHRMLYNSGRQRLENLRKNMRRFLVVKCSSRNLRKRF